MTNYIFLYVSCVCCEVSIQNWQCAMPYVAMNGSYTFVYIWYCARKVPTPKPAFVPPNARYDTIQHAQAAMLLQNEATYYAFLFYFDTYIRHRSPICVNLQDKGYPINPMSIFIPRHVCKVS